VSSSRNKSEPLLLPALLRLASQVMTERLSAWLEASDYKGLQPAHSAAIQPLWERPEGERITALARASRITKQSMSALVNDLEAGGYVERISDPEDARATRVRLTPRGRSYARAVRNFAREIETEWAAQLGARRIEDLRATLEQLRARILTVGET
jgi:DNA-binding MarR family transcriptional regulator